MGASVFLACPLTHHGALWDSCVRAHSGLRPDSDTRVYVKARQSSLLAHNFNALWCEALNRRQELGLTHFAMLHSDIIPEVGWLDRLITEQQRMGVQVLSCVVPLKDDRGLTSTALYELATGGIRALSLREIQAFAPSFDASALSAQYQLLINTGCWVCDFTQPWVEQVHFQCQDWIQAHDAGIFGPETMPEDWDFSLQCHALGVSLAATRMVKLAHVGTYEYRNDVVWSTVEYDTEGHP